MNLRPSGYEPDELPDCSTPHQTDEKYRISEWCGATDICQILEPKTNFSEASFPLPLDRAGIIDRSGSRCTQFFDLNERRPTPAGR